MLFDVENGHSMSYLDLVVTLATQQSRWWRPDKTVRALNTAAKTSAASANMQLVPGLVNSIQFYSLYLTYIYICYHAPRTQRKNTASPHDVGSIALHVSETKGSWRKRRDE
jgi:hypothetical protein